MKEKNNERFVRALVWLRRNYRKWRRNMANWIAKAVGKNPGKLHRELGVPKGEKIPAKKMAKAAKSKSPTIRKEVQLARTLKGLKKNKES